MNAKDTAIFKHRQFIAQRLARNVLLGDMFDLAYPDKVVRYKPLIRRKWSIMVHLGILLSRTYSIALFLKVADSIVDNHMSHKSALEYISEQEKKYLSNENNQQLVNDLLYRQRVKNRINMRAGRTII
jgi:hypothetical protein